MPLSPVLSIRLSENTENKVKLRFSVCEVRNQEEKQELKFNELYIQSVSCQER